jgi:hypothetical protein
MSARGAWRRTTAPDEIVMNAHGNLQLRRRALSPLPRDDRHVFGYFLLLDPLQETLADRIDNAYVPRALAPAARRRPAPHASHKLWDRLRRSPGRDGDGAGAPHEPRAQLATRMGVMRCVVSALQYLHDD